jgi:hypothetical protein
MSEPTTTPPTPEPPPAPAPFEAPSEYTAALERILPLANMEIAVFDRDLRDGDWNSPSRQSVLRAFLLSPRSAKLTIVVHDTAYIAAHLPRLVALLTDFNHKMQILRTIEDGRNAWDAFTIVDRRHVVHRFHQNLMRGELVLDGFAKASELHRRLDEILLFTEPGVNATQLGL